MSETMKFRKAVPGDEGLILTFIRELADYEGMLDQVVADEATLHTWIFEKEKAEVLFVLEGETEVGFALFFHNFSTFLGRAGIYLEDLFVLPEERPFSKENSPENRSFRADGIEVEVRWGT